MTAEKIIELIMDELRYSEDQIADIRNTPGHPITNRQAEELTMKLFEAACAHPASKEWTRCDWMNFLIYGAFGEGYVAALRVFNQEIAIFVKELRKMIAAEGSTPKGN